MRRRLVAIVAAGLCVVLAAPASAKDEAGVADQATGIFTLRDEGADPFSFLFGNPNDVPFMGDWNCDGHDTPGLYRRSDGFVYLRDSNTTGVADITFLFGNPGDLPMVGDFDGDGCDTVSLYRPSEQRFYIINELGEDGGGLGFADYSYLFGNPGDEPFIGDWNGDGVDTAGFRRPSDGVVYLRNSNTTGVADLDFLYGNPFDIPFAGDWDGDGDDTVGLFRPSEGMIYLRNSNSTGIAHETECLGDPFSRPVAGDFGTFDRQPPGTPPRFGLRLVASGLANPLLVKAPPGDCRLFVVEQGGDIEILKGGSKLATPFLDITVTSGGERGLLGLAFHPDYDQNGKFYVNYTIGTRTRISEFTVSSDPNRADHSSERILLDLAQPFSNHNGGALEFDDSGYLLIALGDGGGGGDPGDRAENPNDLLGKILRIDVNETAGPRPYGIPPDNPLAGGGGAPEVWMLGLRNPWRIAMDGSRLYIADVGQNTWEEVNVVSNGGGLDFGWNTWEGNHCFEGPCSPSGFVFPIVEYVHPEGCSITGGYVYRGRMIENLDGTYFYGDFCGGWVKSFVFDGSSATNHVDRTSQLGGSVGLLSSFGHDGFGEIYLTSFTGGRVFKLFPSP